MKTFRRLLAFFRSIFTRKPRTIWQQLRDVRNEPFLTGAEKRTRTEKILKPVIEEAIATTLEKFHDETVEHVLHGSPESDAVPLGLNGMAKELDDALGDHQDLVDSLALTINQWPRSHIPGPGAMAEEAMQRVSEAMIKIQTDNERRRDHMKKLLKPDGKRFHTFTRGYGYEAKEGKAILKTTPSLFGVVDTHYDVIGVSCCSLDDEFDWEEARRIAERRVAIGRKARQDVLKLNGRIEVDIDFYIPASPYVLCLPRPPHGPFRENEILDLIGDIAGAVNSQLLVLRVPIDDHSRRSAENERYIMRTKMSATIGPVMDTRGREV